MFVDAMSGVPSIVAGLFIYTVWLISLGNGGSGFAACLALSILMLPTVARTAEEVLRLVPGGLREASLAMGATEWRTVWSIVLPTARNGLITAVVLGIARVVGETAPLIMTSFGSTKLNANPFTGLQASLPLSVYQLLANPFAAQQQRAYAGAFVLVFLVLTLFTIARILGNRKSGRKSSIRRLFKKRSAL
jgi:phosphate transport system permease protein